MTITYRPTALAALGLFVSLIGCSQRHSSLVSPGPPKVSKDFDFEQMDRFKSDFDKYTAAVEGTSAAASAAASAATACPTAASTGTATQLVFCIQAGRVVVEVQDASQNVVGDATNPVSISSAPTASGSPVTVTPTGGIAAFDQLSVDCPGNYTFTATAAGLQSATITFAALANPGRALYFRNKIVDRFMGDIDNVYGEYTNALYIGKGFESVAGDIVTLGATAATAITLVTRTKTILAALATAAAGVSLSIDKNLFGQQTFAALTIAMAARRAQGQNSIHLNEQMSVTDYSIDSARKDLIAYFYAGTLPGAIQEIQQEAATTSANASGKVGSAAKLAFTQTPNGATSGPVTVQVQIQDSSGNLVSTATNPVSITASPTTITGTSTANATAGVATLSLTFTAQNTYTLTATSPGLASATSPAITIVAAGSPVPPSAALPAPRPQIHKEGLQ